MEARHATVCERLGTPAGGVMGLTLATKEFERSLAVNIALLARIFKKR